MQWLRATQASHSTADDAARNRRMAEGERTMRIARFNGGRIGIVVGDTIHDVTAAAGVDPAEWPPVGMVRVIANFSALRDKLAAAARSAPALSLANVRLETPVPWPNKIIAYPTNYRDHAAEMSTTTHADLQGYFLKANSSLSGPNDAIELPDMPGREIHHECEIALVIGKEGRRIPAARAFDHVFGYACLLDITIRGKEERVMRKSFDTFTPVGPWITTADEVPDPADIRMRLWVNGEKRQEASTKDLIVDIPRMIEIASSASTLYPGDLIATGTPAGVGPLRAGDEVTIEVDDVGRMRVPVVAAKSSANPVFTTPYEFKRAAV
jgi:2-keto-4-pentenoate hydratase/2-oxohepta-3-ene-1,7-dioic acid hydratase in catechol pathway